MPETPVFGHVINGEKVYEGDVLERRNPADFREVAALYHVASPATVEAAIASARDAFESWSGLPRPIRGEVVFRAAALLDTPEWRERFVKAMLAETGKSNTDAVGETQKTFQILFHMAGLGTHTPDRRVHPYQPGVNMYTMTEPVGVVAAVGPSNFPVAVPAWKIAPALTAGCTVVFKPSPAAPITAALLVELFNTAIAQTMQSYPALKNSGIGPGILNMVHGGPTVVHQIADDPRIEAFTFTGATEVGRELLLRVMSRKPRPIDPRHVVFELGGQNALVVLRDISGQDLDTAADAAIAGYAGGKGERCTATSRFVVEEPVYDQFMERVVARSQALKIGPGRDSQNQVGALISEESLERVLRKVEASVQNGMTLLTGGHRLTDGDRAHGYFMEGTVLEGDPDNEGHLALREEIFGPVAGACRVTDLDHALHVVNETVGHKHAVSIYTRDRRQAGIFKRRAKVGNVHVWNPTFGGDPHVAFGGFGGDTSYGLREMGLDCMLSFLRDKTIDDNEEGRVLAAGAR